MTPLFRSPVRRTLVAVFCGLLIVGGSLLPVFGAETKKKSSSSKSGSSTPSKKKSATPKGTPKATPKSTPKKKSSTPSKSTNAGSTPENSKKKSSATATPAAEEKADSATEEPKPSSSTDTDAAMPKPAASEEVPKSTPKPKATPAGEIPNQPAPPLPTAAEPTSKPRIAPNVTLDPADLLAFEEQPARVQQMIESALVLAGQKLTYTYGSADPNNGGMDCSGAIHYLLTQQGFKDVPRDASGQYVWARKNGQFFAVVSKKADSFEFGDLLPGDLLFWNGTYSVQKDPPVTHSMIYLGVQRKRAQHVMWGSSDGRSYDGKPRWGVSVFDFKMPRADKANAEPSKVDFLGYARIPGLRVQGAE